MKRNVFRRQLLKQMKKTMIITGLVAAMVVSTAGCGKGAGNQGSGVEANSENGQNGDSGDVVVGNVVVPKAANQYKASYQTLEAGEENVYYSNFSIVGDQLYMNGYYYDEETGDNTTYLVCKDKNSLDTKWTIDVSDLVKEVLGSEFAIGEGEHYGVNLCGYHVGENEIHLIAELQTFNEDYSNVQKAMIQAGVDFEGQMNAGCTLPELADMKNDQGELIYISHCLMTVDNIWVLSTDQKLLIVDQDGKLTGEIEIGTWPEGIYQLADGSIYVKYYDMAVNEPVFRQVDAAGKKLGESLKNIPVNANGVSVCKDIPDKLMIYDSEGIYIYDMKEQASTLEMKWIDSDIMGDRIGSVAWLGDSHFAAIAHDWDSNTTELVDLTKLAEGEVQEKTQINLATLSGSDSNLSEAVVSFNKSQDKYRVNIVNYYDWESGMEYQDAVTNLQNSVMGSNCPDIIELSSLDTESLASKKVLADLRPMFENSSKVDLGDYLSSVVAAYTVEDRLIAMPNSFSVSTIVVSGKDFDQAGWTLEEAIQYAKNHPDAEFAEYASRATLYDYFLSYTMDKFIDWDNGTCNLDCQEFKDLLTYLAGFAQEFDWENYDYDSSDSTPVKISKGELLTTMAYISNIEELQVYDAMFGGQANFIGYPTLDGTPVSAINSYDCYGIAENGNKEGAWAFYEYYLSRETDNRYGWGLPTSKKKLQERIDEELKKSAAGESNGSGIGYGDWDYFYHYATQDEVDRLMEVLDMAAPHPLQNGEIMKIITEEAEPFYQGQKTVDDVVAIIQSRVKIFVAEHM